MRWRPMSWALVLSLTATAAGGCERSPDEARRVPRAAVTTLELFDDDAKELRVHEELIGRLSVVPPPPVAVRPAVRTTAPRRAEPSSTQTVTDERRVDEERGVQPERRAEEKPRAQKAEQPAPPERQPSWYTPPASSSQENVANVLVAVGAFAIAMGNIAAVSDGDFGSDAFAATALGLGVASFGTAFVLYETDPGPKPAMRVSIGPGMLRGSF